MNNSNLKKVLIIGIVVLLTGCGNKAKNNIEDNQSPLKVKFGDIQLELLKNENCFGKIDEYYEFDKGKIYTVCVDKINITDLYVIDSNNNTDTNKFKSLKEYFSNSPQNFDDSINYITNQMEVVESYKNGKIKLYQKDNLRIIKCDKLDGKQAIYIGDGTLSYIESYCE